jgi:hypothetical protein
MAQDRYAKNAGAVFSLKFHVVWCPKYRRSVLTPPVDERLKELLADSLIPSFQTTANRPLNELHCEMVSAKRTISGDSLCSGMVGMSS